MGADPRRLHGRHTCQPCAQPLQGGRRQGQGLKQERDRLVAAVDRERQLPEDSVKGRDNIHEDPDMAWPDALARAANSCMM